MRLWAKGRVQRVNKKVELRFWGIREGVREGHREGVGGLQLLIKGRGVEQATR